MWCSVVHNGSGAPDPVRVWVYEQERRQRDREAWCVWCVVCVQTDRVVCVVCVWCIMCFYKRPRDRETESRVQLWAIHFSREKNTDRESIKLDHLEEAKVRECGV